MEIEVVDWKLADSALSSAVGVLLVGDKTANLEVAQREWTWPLRITLPCGSVRVYASFDDFPREDVLCECRLVTYEHWFVRYDELPDGN